MLNRPLPVERLDITGGSDSDGDLHSELGSPVDGNFRDGSPDRDFTRDESTDQELSEEASYRESEAFGHLWAGIRFLNLTVFHLQMTTLLPVPEFSQPGKSVKLLVDDWLCRKMEKLNLTIAGGYPSRNAETA